ILEARAVRDSARAGWGASFVHQFEEGARMIRRETDRQITRRSLLHAMGALGLTGLIGLVPGLPEPGSAQGNLATIGPEEPVDATMKRLFAGKPIKDGAASITLDLPLIAENGAVVPLTVDVAAPMTPQSYVKTIYVISDKNRRPLNAKFNLT